MTQQDRSCALLASPARPSAPLSMARQFWPSAMSELVEKFYKPNNEGKTSQDFPITPSPTNYTAPDYFSVTKPGDDEFGLLQHSLNDLAQGLQKPGSGGAEPVASVFCRENEKSTLDKSLVVADHKPVQLFSRDYKDFVKNKSKYKNLGYNDDFPSVNKREDFDEIASRVNKYYQIIASKDASMERSLGSFAELKKNLATCYSQLMRFKKAFVLRIQQTNGAHKKDMDFQRDLEDIGQLETQLNQLRATIDQKNKLILDIDSRLDEEKKLRGIIHKNQQRRNKIIGFSIANLVVAAVVIYAIKTFVGRVVKTWGDQLLAALRQ